MLRRGFLAAVLGVKRPVVVFGRASLYAASPVATVQVACSACGGAMAILDDPAVLAFYEDCGMQHGAGLCTHDRATPRARGS